MTMLDPRWNKVLNDLWDNKARTILVVLSIAVGVFAFSSVFISSDAMLSNMNTQWQSTTPSAISLSLAPFDEDLVRVVRGMPGVYEVEGNVSVALKLIQEGTTPYTIDIRTVRDF